MFCKPLTPPSIYYQAYGAVGIIPHENKYNVKIYVPRSAYDIYINVESPTTEYEGKESQRHWYRYKDAIEPYDFDIIPSTSN